MLFFPLLSLCAATSRREDVAVAVNEVGTAHAVRAARTVPDGLEAVQTVFGGYFGKFAGEEGPRAITKQEYEAFEARARHLAEQARQQAQQLRRAAAAREAAEFAGRAPVAVDSDYDQRDREYTYTAVYEKDGVRRQRSIGESEYNRWKEQFDAQKERARQASLRAAGTPTRVEELINMRNEVYGYQAHYANGGTRSLTEDEYNQWDKTLRQQQAAARQQTLRAHGTPTRVEELTDRRNEVYGYQAHYANGDTASLTEAEYNQWDKTLRQQQAAARQQTLRDHGTPTRIVDHQDNRCENEKYIAEFADGRSLEIYYKQFNTWKAKGVRVVTVPAACA